MSRGAKPPPKLLGSFVQNLPKNSLDWEAKRGSVGINTWQGLRLFINNLTHGDNACGRDILHIYRAMLCIVDLKTGQSLAEVNKMMAGFINQTKAIKKIQSEDYFQRIRSSASKLLGCIGQLSERIGYHAYEVVLLYGL